MHKVYFLHWCDVAAIHETAYPRIKSNLSQKELDSVFTPTDQEVQLAKKHTRGPKNRLWFLVLMKSVQRLGYFPVSNDVPEQVVSHLAEKVGVKTGAAEAESYERNGYRHRHIPVIRRHLETKPYLSGGRKLLIRSVADAAQTKDALPDLINLAIETLIAQRFELPGFSTLVKAARRVRNLVSGSTYTAFGAECHEDLRRQLNGLFAIDEARDFSFWDELKKDPGPATIDNMRQQISRLEWLRDIEIPERTFQLLPFARYRRFVNEARSMDAARMMTIREDKRIALALCLVKAQLAQTYDDIAEMFIKTCNKMHWRARHKLEGIRLKNQHQVDELVRVLSDVATCWKEPSDAGRESDLEQIFRKSTPDDLIKRCSDHLIFAGNNWLSLLPSFYNNRRYSFFKFVRLALPKSTTSDDSLEKAICFIQKHQGSHRKQIPIKKYFDEAGSEDIETCFSWVPDKWKNTILVKDDGAYPTSIDKKMFEICVFTCVMQDLKSGDLFIKGGEKFGDWRFDLISQNEFEQALPEFCKRTGLPEDTETFIGNIHSELAESIQETDSLFPDNEGLIINGGNLSLKRLRARPEPTNLREVERQILDQIPLSNIPQILMETDRWVSWTKNFKPISGFEKKIDSPQERYVGTTFCYGCNLGPSQTARSLVGTERKQLAWIDERHIAEESIEEAITGVINQYNKLSLPKIWGSGKSAGSDGTQWDVYERNLLSEYHIRYGGWGGIGYYHVSDTYIALFSNFIACGVWEGVHILDGLVSNESDIQPDTLHADTQGQSESIFGLSALLGIKLMPRIRNWGDLTFYLPEKGMKLEHLEDFFKSHIDWELIRRHLPDMLRVAVSVSRGRVAPSTILRRLNSASRKNKLYFAFRELGRACRTTFLMQYLNSIDLRYQVQAATNISESWNEFTQWIAFGGNKLRKPDRAGQSKLIRYNHLVANLVVLYNTVQISNVLEVFALENRPIDKEIISRLSPYTTENINRFGKYELSESPNSNAVCYSDFTNDNKYLSHLC